MGTALEHRSSRWVDLVGDLLQRPAGEFPRDLLLDQLRDDFGCTSSWNWRDEDTSFGFELSDPIPGWPEPDQLEVWGRFGLSRHPLITWFASTGDLTAMSMGRVPASVATPRSLHQARDELLPVALEQQLSIPYRSTALMHRAFVLARSGDDFSEEDLAVARRIQPLITLLARQSAVTTSAGVGDTLTGRESAVLQLLADGHTAAGIGRQLGISARTVHVHLDHLYRKLGVRDRLMAVREAREQGLLRARPCPPPQRQTSISVGSSGIGAQPPSPHLTRPLPIPVAGQRAVAWRPGVGPLQPKGVG